MKTMILVCCCLLAGCESTRDFAHRHPVATGLGLAIVVGSIAASVNHGSSHENSPDVQLPSNPCKTPQTCQ